MQTQTNTQICNYSNISQHATRRPNTQIYFFRSSFYTSTHARHTHHTRTMHTTHAMHTRTIHTRTTHIMVHLQHAAHTPQPKKHTSLNTQHTIKIKKQHKTTHACTNSTHVVITIFFRTEKGKKQVLYIDGRKKNKIKKNNNTQSDPHNLAQYSVHFGSIHGLVGETTAGG